MLKQGLSDVMIIDNFSVPFLKDKLLGQVWYISPNQRRGLQPAKAQEEGGALGASVFLMDIYWCMCGSLVVELGANL